MFDQTLPLVGGASVEGEGYVLVLREDPLCSLGEELFSLLAFRWVGRVPARWSIALRWGTAAR